MKVKEENEKAFLKLSIQKSKNGILSHHFMANKAKVVTVTDFIFLGSKITVDMTVAMKLRKTAPWKTNYNKGGQHIKRQRHHYADKGLCSQTYGFSSSHVWI